MNCHLFLSDINFEVKYIFKYLFSFQLELCYILSQEKWWQYQHTDIIINRPSWYLVCQYYSWKPKLLKCGSVSLTRALLWWLKREFLEAGRSQLKKNQKPRLMSNQWPGLVEFFTIFSFSIDLIWKVLCTLWNQQSTFYAVIC